MQKKRYIAVDSQVSYLGFPLKPSTLESKPDFSHAVEEWVKENGITNVVTYDEAAAIPLARAIPTYGRVILVADLSEQGRIQFLSNVLHLFLGQKIVLYSEEEWSRNPVDYDLPIFSNSMVRKE